MDIALAIIDMQNDFVLPDAPLCVAGAAASISIIRGLLDRARQLKWNIFHIIREHRADGVDSEYFRTHFYHDGQGFCISGTKGAEIVKELQPLKGEIILKKQRFSGFFHTELDLILRRLRIKTLILAGTQYPNCIRATAVDGLSFDYQIIVVTDACSAQTPEIAQANICDMKNMGILCVRLSELDAALETIYA